jgi:electron transfer flavoprotein alpha subunit
MSVLVIAEIDGTTLKPSTAAVVGAATQLPGPLHLLVMGSGVADTAKQGAFQGVEKILVADDPSLKDHTAEAMTPVIIATHQAGGYGHILAPATAFGKNVLPRVAALLDVQQISDVCAIDTPDTFRRPIYAGNAIATVQSSDTLKVMTVRPTNFAAAPLLGTMPATASVDVAAAKAGAQPSAPVPTLESRELSSSARPELTAARVVVSGGRGVGSAENFKIIEALADKLGAAVGASRAAVDAGYVPNDYQVGQTGKVVAPDLYMAVGISGAIQHLAGMKDSKIIVAINKDPDAPIFNVADYGLVADLFTAVPDLTGKL